MAFDEVSEMSERIFLGLFRSLARLFHSGWVLHVHLDFWWEYPPWVRWVTLSPLAPGYPDPGVHCQLGWGHFLVFLVPQMFVLGRLFLGRVIGR